MSTNVMPGTVGQFGFLAAHNFITPEGWDSLCISPVNVPRREGIPSLNCLVETDWYPQNTEFRFAFERGEALTLTHDTPLGQVIFVPRQAVRLVDALPEASVARAAPMPSAAGPRTRLTEGAPEVGLFDVKNPEANLLVRWLLATGRIRACGDGYHW